MNAVWNVCYAIPDLLDLHIVDAIAGLSCQERLGAGVTIGNTP